MHDTVHCHYQPMTEAQYEQAVRELARAHEALLNGYRNAD
jgi:hypothetical protein